VKQTGKKGIGYLRTYRNEIKDPIIAEARINPQEYKTLRGSQSPYIHDEADGIIIEAAGTIFEYDITKLEVFWLVYSCKTYEQTREEIPKFEGNGEVKLLKIETVKKYARVTKKAVKEFLKKNTDIRKEIKETIRKEYAKHKAS
jgi:hypothetical protein